VIEQLGLIGCGLMGGSFALGLKRAGLVRKVVGYSKSPTTTERARGLGVIDVAANSALMAVSGSQVVLIAIPVAATGAVLKAIQTLVQADTLLMDVGSTKVEVVLAAERALRGRFSSFVPAHPIAGRESSGIEHADAELYRGRRIVLTPNERTSIPHLELATELWQALGGHVTTMTPQAHDNAFAAVSHLPHLLAFAAMNAITSQDQGAELLSLAGPGFRDFTRIAASDTNIWRDILLSNKRSVLEQSQQFRQALAEFERAMAGDDENALASLIERASQARAGWRISSGSGQG
jgi:prephenate dehydrogenase